MRRLPRAYSVQVVDDPNPAVGNEYGAHLVNAGDVNGDGEDDLLVGIDEHGGIDGYLHVYSGAGGSLISRVPNPDPPPDPTDDGRPPAWGNYVSKVPDIGSCLGGAPGEPCALREVGPRDGVPDHLVGAGGQDLSPDAKDVGAAYMIDGATGAILKKILMPPADRLEQAAVPVSAKGGDPRNGFGATVLVPLGQAPCDGNAGLGPCDLERPRGAGQARLPMPEEVKIGDVNGGGFPDFVIAARSYHDTPASNPACPQAPCFQSGRVYVYAGERVAGSDPDDVLETPLYTIKNPLAQWDDPDTNPRYYREAFGYSLSPVGDVGRCTKPDVVAGGYCFGSSNFTSFPDGRPDFVASVHRVDMFGMGDVGAAFVIDGATGAIVNVLTHPNPQPTAIFGYNRTNQPMLGDIGSSEVPDAFIGAMVQNVTYRAQGQGYVVNADQSFGGANHASLSILNDPTPDAVGNFGSISAGVGDLVGDSKKEVMVGAAGPHAPAGVNGAVVGDVQIFNPQDSSVLQTIPAPDPQQGAGFGRALAPLGDLNDDGFLDFAVGADLYDSVAADGTPLADAGRFYIFRSDNRIERRISLGLSRHLIAAGRVVVDTGSLVVGDVSSCVDGVTVKIVRNGQRVKTTSTDSTGRYRVRLPDRTGRYRAVALPTTFEDVTCLRDASGLARHRH